MKKGPKRDWAERAAQKVSPCQTGYCSPVACCEGCDLATKVARALRRVGKREYAKGFAAALQTPKQRWKARGESEAFIRGMQRQKWLMEAAEQSKAAERRGKRRARV